MAPKRKLEDDWDGPNMFSHWLDPDWNPPKLPEAGIGIFDHWLENDQPEDDGTGGMFRHWLED